MRFRISHHTRFDYERPAWDSHNEVRLHPRDNAIQHCVAFTLRTEPPGAILAYDDFFGNHVHAIAVAAPHDALSVIADSTVAVTTPVPVAYPEVPFSRFLTDDQAHTTAFFEFLGPSRFIPFSERLRKFFWNGARPRGAEDVTAYVNRVLNFVRDQFEYETTRTHVHSSVNDILKSGGGVCQDFAHLTIGLLRLAGVPARYVSGYLAPPDGTHGGLGAQASHAWLEAWLPGPGWTGFDPTNRCATDERHLVMAIGRDYGDVPPIRGSFRSRGERSWMRVELDVTRAAVSATDHHRRKLCQSQQ